LLGSADPKKKGIEHLQVNGKLIFRAISKV
jgi:hypothetical protein